MKAAGPGTKSYTRVVLIGTSGRISFSVLLPRFSGLPTKAKPLAGTVTSMKFVAPCEYALGIIDDVTATASAAAHSSVLAYIRGVASLHAWPAIARASLAPDTRTTECARCERHLGMWLQSAATFYRETTAAKR